MRCLSYADEREDRDHAIIRGILTATQGRTRPEVLAAIHKDAQDYPDWADELNAIAAKLQAMDLTSYNTFITSI